MADIDTTNMRRLDVTLLLVFRELIRSGRTTRAAEHLGLSQPAISHALARLRDIFRDELFLRRPNGLHPTSRALDLAPKIDAALACIEDAVDSVEHFDAGATRRVFRLTANDLVGTLLTGSITTILRREAPNARLAISFAVGRESLDAIQRNEADLALGRLDHVPAGFRATPLFDEDFVVVARKTHPTVGQALDLDTYIAAAHVLVSFRGGFEGMVDHALKKSGLSRQVAVSVPMFMTALAAVADSDLVATVPRRLANRYAEKFGLTRFAPPVRIPAFSFVSVRHVRTLNDKGLDWLQDKIKAGLEHVEGAGL